MDALRRNPALLCAFHGLQMSLFPMAVITVFWQREIGLSMFRILALQGFFGLAMAVFEFPSGYLADRWGYRISLIGASVLMVFGWGLYTVADSFATVIVAELILGVGMSLISGCDSALLYESLLATGRETEFALWSGRMRFWGQAAEGTAALVAGWLYALSSRLPFVVELGVWVFALLLALRLVEPPRAMASTAGTWGQIRSLVRFALWDNLALRRVFGLTVVLSLASFIPVWLIQLYALDAGVSEGWLGPLWAAANYTVALGSLASHRLTARLGIRTVLGGCVLLVAVGYLGLGSSHHLWGFAFYFLLTLMRGLFYPALHHAEQRLIPSRDRAGLVSLRSLVFRTAFLVCGPLIGLGVDRFGQHPILLGIGGVLTLAAWLGWWRVGKGGGEPTAPDPAPSP